LFHAGTGTAEDPAMRSQLVLVATLALFGCASPDYGAHDLTLGGAARSGVREALQQQLDLPNCRTKAHRDATKLADAAEISAPAVAYEAAKQYAQLDDPTKDWTRQQSTGSSLQCPPTGRKHRFFA
jgi:hypothetical protein